MHSGHSFVRRSKCAMLGERYHKNTYMDTDNGNIDKNTTTEARQLAKDYRVTNKISRIHTHAKGIAFIGDILEKPTHLTSLTPDMIVFELGSNELAQLKDGWDRNRIFIIANQLKGLAAYFCPNTICVFMGVLPRVNNISCTPESFRIYANWFNDFLRQFAKTSMRGIYPQNLRYHHMQGWAYKKDNRGRDVERSASEWLGHDNIHPHKRVFKDKYAHTFRKAMLNNENLPLRSGRRYTK